MENNNNHDNTNDQQPPFEVIVHFIDPEGATGVSDLGDDGAADHHHFPAEFLNHILAHIADNDLLLNDEVVVASNEDNLNDLASLEDTNNEANNNESNDSVAIENVPSIPTDENAVETISNETAMASIDPATTSQLKPAKKLSRKRKLTPKQSTSKSQTKKAKISKRKPNKKVKKPSKVSKLSAMKLSKKKSPVRRVKRGKIVKKKVQAQRSRKQRK